MHMHRHHKERENERGGSGEERGESEGEWEEKSGIEGKKVYVTYITYMHTVPYSGYISRV